MADRAGLTRHATALDLDHRVVATLRPGHPERQADVGLVDRVAEVFVQRATVDDDLALTRQEPDAGDGGLASTGAGEERSRGHFSNSSSGKRLRPLGLMG